MYTRAIKPNLWNLCQNRDELWHTLMVITNKDLPQKRSESNRLTRVKKEKFSLTVSTDRQLHWSTVARSFLLNLPWAKTANGQAFLLTKGLRFIQSLTFDSLHSLVWLMLRLYSSLKWSGDLVQRAWHFYTLLLAWFTRTGTDRDEGVQEKGGGNPPISLSLTPVYLSSPTFN